MFKQIIFSKFEIISTIIIIFLGIFLHFTFELSNNSILVGIFSPVNESIWEHLKLIFFPMLISTIIGYFYKGKNIDNYLWAKTQGIILAMIFIVIFYYTYTGIIGKNIDFVNIVSYFIAVILGQYYANRKMEKRTYKDNNLLYVAFVLVILCLFFIIFTFYPPNINLFKDPITGTFGIFRLNKP